VRPSWRPAASTASPSRPSIAGERSTPGSTGAEALTIDWARDNRPALIETAGGTEERFYDASGRLARIKFDSGESIDRIVTARSTTS
jgi:hypothetical protein